MKKTNYIFIGILFINDLYSMKRSLPEEQVIEIYEDLEDGLNPDSENSVPHNFLFVKNKESTQTSDHAENTVLPDSENNPKAFVVIEDSPIQERRIVTAPMLSSEKSSTENNAENTGSLRPENNYKISLFIGEKPGQESRTVTVPVVSGTANSTETIGSNVKIKESLSDIMKIRGVFSVNENITFAANYFDKLFGYDNCIKNIFHSVHPQLIVLMMKFAKKEPYNSKEGARIIRRVCGILCTPFYKESSLLYEIGGVRIITHKNDVIFHISLEKTDNEYLDRMTGIIPYLYRHMSKNSDYIKDILQENLIYCSRQIKTSKDTETAERQIGVSSKQGQKIGVTRSVKELSDLGNFPNIIIKSNEFCPESKSDFLYFPLSYKEPIAFITSVDWMQKSV